MNRHRPASTTARSWSRLAALLLLTTVCLGASGCRLLGPEPEPARPETVSQWMKQPRVGNGVVGR